MKRKTLFKKKMFQLLLCVALLTAVTGCGSSSGGSNGRATGGKSSVEAVLQAGMAESDKKDASSAGADQKEKSDVAAVGGQAADPLQTDLIEDNLGIYESESEEISSQEKERLLSSTEGIDVDLTALSSTLVYSEVFNMVSAPENYIGKTIKMDGAFRSFHDDSTGNDYFSCIIQDATACCAQGLEFVLTDDYSYPQDYPEEGGFITVIGVFDTYMEGEYMYCTLRNASLEL